MRVFMSYAQIDEELAGAIAAGLDDLSITYVCDRKMPDWADDVPSVERNGLGAAAELLVILSPASVRSLWLPFEVGFASALCKTVLGFVCHPSLELPAFLQNAYCAATLEDLQRFFVGETPVDRALAAASPTMAHLCESAAMVAVDTMRLLLSVATPRSYGIHIRRYPEHLAVVKRSFRVLAAEGAKDHLHDGTRRRVELLCGRLKWFLERLSQPQGRPQLHSDYFRIFAWIHREVANLVRTLIPSTTEELHEWLDAYFEGEGVGQPRSADELIALRHRIQGAYLESGQIHTIWDDVDNKLAIPYLMIDERLVPLFMTVEEVDALVRASEPPQADPTTP